MDAYTQALKVLSLERAAFTDASASATVPPHPAGSARQGSLPGHWRRRRGGKASARVGRGEASGGKRARGSQSEKKPQSNAATPLSPPAPPSARAAHVTPIRGHPVSALRADFPPESAGAILAAQDLSPTAAEAAVAGEAAVDGRRRRQRLAGRQLAWGAAAPAEGSSSVAARRGEAGMGERLAEGRGEAQGEADVVEVAGGGGGRGAGSGGAEVGGGSGGVILARGKTEGRMGEYGGREGAGKGLRGGEGGGREAQEAGERVEDKAEAKRGERGECEESKEGGKEDKEEGEEEEEVGGGRTGKQPASQAGAAPYMRLQASTRQPSARQASTRQLLNPNPSEAHSRVPGAAEAGGGGACGSEGEVDVAPYSNPVGRQEQGERDTHGHGHGHGHADRKEHPQVSHRLLQQQQATMGLPPTSLPSAVTHPQQPHHPLPPLPQQQQPQIHQQQQQQLAVPGSTAAASTATPSQGVEPSHKRPSEGFWAHVEGFFRPVTAADVALLAPAAYVTRFSSITEREPALALPPVGHPSSYSALVKSKGSTQAGTPLALAVGQRQGLGCGLDKGTETGKGNAPGAGHSGGQGREMRMGGEVEGDGGQPGLQQQVQQKQKQQQRRRQRQQGGVGRVEVEGSDRRLRKRRAGQMGEGAGDVTGGVGVSVGDVMVPGSKRRRTRLGGGGGGSGGGGVGGAVSTQDSGLAVTGAAAAGAAGAAAARAAAAAAGGEKLAEGSPAGASAAAAAVSDSSQHASDLVACRGDGCEGEGGGGNSISAAATAGMPHCAHAAHAAASASPATAAPAAAAAAAVAGSTDAAVRDSHVTAGSGRGGRQRGRGRGRGGAGRGEREEGMVVTVVSPPLWQVPARGRGRRSQEDEGRGGRREGEMGRKGVAEEEVEEEEGGGEGEACDVCCQTDSDDVNPIVFCDGCDVPVHRQCYGIPAAAVLPVLSQQREEGKGGEGQEKKGQGGEEEDASLPWLCARCSSSRPAEVRCELCPVPSGAFKPALPGAPAEERVLVQQQEEAKHKEEKPMRGVPNVVPKVEQQQQPQQVQQEEHQQEQQQQEQEGTEHEQQQQFAHLFCSQWVPETYVGDTESMQPVCNVGGSAGSAAACCARCAG
ncbi:hypothetical protein CLOM_g9148 [Closterium sp. NIES-68]|nr:hypothetical protein CLOM_g9148 [Closterium sp. NIES-68]